MHPRAAKINDLLGDLDRLGDRLRAISARVEHLADRQAHAHPGALTIAERLDRCVALAKQAALLRQRADELMQTLERETAEYAEQIHGQKAEQDQTPGERPA